ncbi:MAG: VirB8/TrbF family protein [Alphaproteobacteria bacterium]|nr:VirB8/TrbF family protein [Alphaproteobacteria bacterium]
MQENKEETIYLRSQLMKKRIYRAEWISSLVMISAFFLLFLNFIFTIFFLQLLPYLRVVALPVTQEMTSKETVQIEPIDNQIQSIDKIHETLIRFFVERYHSTFPDETELTRRWNYGGDIYTLAGDKVYASFYKTYMTNISNYVNEAAPVVDINIIKTSHVGNNWQVEFDARTFSSDGTPPLVVRYIAALYIQDLKERIYYGKNIINPVGMTVMDYRFSIKKRE